MQILWDSQTIHVIFLRSIIILIHLLTWQIFHASRSWPVPHRSPPIFPASCCTIPLFLMSSSTTSMHCFTGLPLLLFSIYFQLQHFLYLHLLIASYNMSEPPQSFLPQILNHLPNSNLKLEKLICIYFFNLKL